VTEVAAALGGSVLVFAIFVTVSSVVLARFGRPILGDTEVVSLCAGVAIALFLPYGQMRGSNVVIEIFTAKLPARWRGVLDFVMCVAFAVVVVVLTWRMMQGGLDAFSRQRASMFLQLPQWWGFAGASLAGALWTIVCIFTAWEQLVVLRGRRRA
jgi:TRAP-type C4-dicarboxylate transport system permease small subunit